MPGVAERARPKFDRAAAWIVAERAGAGVVGFALATTPGSGKPTDPPNAAVLGLIAVHPEEQNRGLGRQLLDAVESTLSGTGCEQLVLHALTDNRPAIRLYEATGWVPDGPTFEHALLQRPTQTYVRTLEQPSGR